jgi:hypothetical protein
MTEVFNELSVIGVEMEEKDKVVHLLASLPESYNTLVTALEACPQVPQMAVVTEKLLYEETKLKDCSKKDEALVTGQSLNSRQREPKCYLCHELGHIQRYCPERAKMEKKQKESEGKKPRLRVNQLSAKRTIASGSDSDSSVGLVTRHVLSPLLDRAYQQTLGLSTLVQLAISVLTDSCFLNIRCWKSHKKCSLEMVIHSKPLERELLL